MNALKANSTRIKVRELQRKLYLASKANTNRRFHAVYDKVYRMDILKEAWKRVKENNGTSGVDEVTISDIKEYGVEKFLQEIQQELEEGIYRAKPVLRCEIPKNDGKGSKRPLGIPAVRDRVVQMATKMVIEPIFEADFKECSYGFRPKKNCHQALEEIRIQTRNGYCWIIDADIKGYFDNINHGKLMQLLEQRLSDRRMLKLIRKWLEAGIMEEGKYRKSLIGSPQGGVISPLLSNIYLNYMDYYWEKHYKHLGKLVRYADDFVVMCETEKQVGEAMKVIESIMGKLELKIHPEKTRIIDIQRGKESFDFLGFTNMKEEMISKFGGTFWRTKQVPSKKSMKKMRLKIKGVLGKRVNLALSVFTPA